MDVEAAAAAEGTDIFLYWDPVGNHLYVQVPPSYLGLNIRDDGTDLC